MEASLNPESIAIALTTLYPKWYKGKLRSIKHTDKIRGDLALEFIKIAKEKGFQVVVVDGKGSKTFRKALKGNKDIIVLLSRKQKRSPMKRLAIKTSSKIKGVRVIVLSEPEKVSIVKDCMQVITSPILNNKADIVVPKREENLFRKTYPSYMYESEIEGNGIYNESLRTNRLLDKKSEDLDMFFGPRALRNDPRIISIFMRRHNINFSKSRFVNEYFDTEEYSNVLYFPIILALKKRLRVQSVTVPFSYSIMQKENEEKGARDLFLEKRKNQRLSLIVELLHFMSYLNKK